MASQLAAPVTEAQMKALFGNGHHPLANQIRQAALDAGLSEREAEKVCRLGRPFAVGVERLAGVQSGP